MKNSISSLVRCSPSRFLRITSCGRINLFWSALTCQRFPITNFKQSLTKAATGRRTPNSGTGQQNNRLRSDSLAPADRVEAFICLCFDTDTTDFSPEDLRNPLPHGNNIRTKFRRFECHGGVEVYYLKAALTGQPHDARKKVEAIRIFPLRILIRKVDAEIAFAQSAENSIGNRMRQSIGVRVSFGAAFRHDMHAPEDKRSPFNQPMHVVSNADPEHYKTLRF